MNRLARNTHILLYYTLLFITLLIAGCGDEEPSNREVFIDTITGTWEVDENSYILIEGQDIATLLLGFEITINSDLTFTTNSDVLTIDEFPWPTAGSFTLNDELTQFTRDDGLVILFSLSEDKQDLDLEFTADGNNIGGRKSGITGGWKCGLHKKQ